MKGLEQFSVEYLKEVINSPADELTVSLARIALASRQHGWVECGERMPEQGQKVLAVINFNSELVKEFVGEMTYTGSTFRRGFATANLSDNDGVVVTHWMPLPPPPFTDPKPE